MLHKRLVSILQWFSIGHLKLSIIEPQLTTSPSYIEFKSLMELTRKASGKQPATTGDPSSLVFKTEVSLGVLLPGQSCANTYTI
jgi:hypothetical protein